MASETKPLTTVQSKVLAWTKRGEVDALGALTVAEKEANP